MKELKTDPKVLLVGIGNYDWGDDSLGWSFVDKMGGQGYDFLDCQYRYKLKPEDAELLSKYDVVVFVSSSEDRLDKGFELSSCRYARNAFFSENDQAPAAILHLAGKLYNSCPKAYLLKISGVEWGLQSYLSREANKNLEAAAEFFDAQFLPSVFGVSV